MDVYIFRRVEKKYRVTSAKKEALLKEIREQLIPDAHGKSTISSLYIDTPDFLLIRNSIAATAYKEKLRLRSYGVPDGDTKVFLEIKKKFKGVVYKRRISLTLNQAYEYMEKGVKPEDSQIMREIDYAMDFYRKPLPKMLVSYEREAYFVKDLPSLRITFDSAVRYREENLRLEMGNDGTRILPDGEFLLEIKTDGAMPMWLARALDRCEIYPSSYSKYGTAYRIKTGQLKLTENTIPEGEDQYVCTV